MEMTVELAAKYGKQCATDMVKWAKEKEKLIDNGIGNKGWVKTIETKYGIGPSSL